MARFDRQSNDREPEEDGGDSGASSTPPRAERLDPGLARSFMPAITVEAETEGRKVMGMVGAQIGAHESSAVLTVAGAEV